MAGEGKCLRNGRKQAEQLFYVPLPEDVVKQIEVTWAAQLMDSGKPIRPAALK